MADFKDRVEAELENIEQVLSRLPKSSSLPNLSELELAGVAALIHSFYNGIENILKQAVREKKLSIPQGSLWHRDLIELAFAHKIISSRTTESLKEYLAFRHFFSHAYAFEIDPYRITSLVENAKTVKKNFLTDIMRFSK